MRTAAQEPGSHACLQVDPRGLGHAGEFTAKGLRGMFAQGGGVSADPDVSRACASFGVFVSARLGCAAAFHGFHGACPFVERISVCIFLRS